MGSKFISKCVNSASWCIMWVYKFLGFNECKRRRKICQNSVCLARSISSDHPIDHDYLGHQHLYTTWRDN